MVLVGAAVVVASGSAGRAKSQVSAGGTLNVGWEQSFGFTDNFDPTGEYLGDWFGIASNLLIRTLVGYNHVAGRPRQHHRARHRDRRFRPSRTAGSRTAARPTRSI